MKKIKINENELVSLIEKLVKENLSSGNGHNFGMLGTPTSKYKDLYEDDDVEGEGDVDEETLDVNVDDETEDGLNQEDAMENIKEAKLVSRLKRKVYTKKPNKTISEQRNIVKWTQEEKDSVIEMVTEIYNDMVQRRDAVPPEGPQG